jgi:hypothetical protein
MADATAAPPPKKRSFFKRAGWQDAPATEGDDLFSHSNKFTDIVAEEQKREKEKRRKAEERKRKAEEQSERKRRKVSVDDAPTSHRSGAGKSTRAGRTSSKACVAGPTPPCAIELTRPRRSKTPTSPVPTQPPPPNSLAARYDTLLETKARKESAVIDLGGSDDDNDDSGYNPKSFNAHPTTSYPSWNDDHKQDIALRPSKSIPVDDDDDLQEVRDPALAALAARARARAAANARAAAPTANGEHVKAPIVQLFIDPKIPDANPLMVKIRTDNTLEKTRDAWCKKQGYNEAMASRVIFVSKGTRVFDSTTVMRLGITIESNGTISVDGDDEIYDDENLPKVSVEAWTQELYAERQKEDAAKKKAAEPPPEVEERTPTPEPVANTKIRLVLKAKGKQDYKLSVNPVSRTAISINIQSTQVLIFAL